MSVKTFNKACEKLFVNPTLWPPVSRIIIFVKTNYAFAARQNIFLLVIDAVRAWHFYCEFEVSSNLRIVRSMAAFMFASIWSQFKFNLLLQIFDGLFTYHVLTQGVPEANPFIRNAIHSWGEIWGLLYWKVFACVLLALIFTLRHFRQSLTLKALTLTSTVYSCLFFVSIYYFLLDLLR